MERKTRATQEPSDARGVIRDRFMVVRIESIQDLTLPEVTERLRLSAEEVNMAYGIRRVGKEGKYHAIMVTAAAADRIREENTDGTVIVQANPIAVLLRETIDEPRYPIRPD